KLAQDVRVFMPSELERAQLEIDSAVSEFQKVQKFTAWIPQRPTWIKKEFESLALNPKVNSWSEMNIQDMDQILRPEPMPWTQAESAILSWNCDYPFNPPKSTILEFNKFPELKVQLEEAILEVNPSAVTRKQLARYFQSEQRKVAEYNKRRSTMLARCDDVNRAIRARNSEAEQRWSICAKESRRLEEEELSKFSVNRPTTEGEYQQNAPGVP